MKPIRLVVSGCCGRMGSLLVEEVLRDREHFELVGGLEHEGHPRLGQPLPGAGQVKVTSDLAALFNKKVDLIIEFTTPEATITHARTAAQGKVPILIGTTDFSTDHLEELRRLSGEVPIFWSPNMSIGIFIVRKLIGSIFELLKKYGLEDAPCISIFEKHHAKKKDAPSGTAKQLKEDLIKASGKPAAEIPVDYKREGEVVGLHSILFDLGPEFIRLEHEARDRRVFGLGALLVAKRFLALGRRPGFYGMDDLEPPSAGHPGDAG